MDLLYAQLEPERVRLGCTVLSVDLEKKTARLDTGETVEYDVLINTMPLNRFLRHTGRGSDAALADKLSYNKVLVFNLGLHGIWLGVLSDQLSRFTLMRRRFRQGNWVNLRI